MTEVTKEEKRRRKSVNRNYKDVLFRRVFGDKKSLLELYNAVNGTSYTQEEELTIVTLEDAIYMNVKNDVAFLMGTYLNLYEHQSTVNENMPLRCLFYIAREYEKLTSKVSLYSSKQQKIPTPRFVVFYNGKQKQPERQVLRLSTAFQNRLETEEPELELRLTVLNINYGQNQTLMKACKKLEDYAFFVDKLRKNALKYEIEEAAERTVEECIQKDILGELLREHRSEVVSMSIFYYDEEKELELIRKDEYELGHEDGLSEGRREGHASGLHEGRESGLREGHIRGLYEGLQQGKRQSIFQLLSGLGEVPAAVREMMEKETDENQLLEWLRLAAQSRSMEEFLEKI